MEQGLVIEPLKELFKDEVRVLGAQLGIPEEMLWRQPFPGPGLALASWARSPPSAWKSSSVPKNSSTKSKPPACTASCGRALPVLPVKAVGVMGDTRTYANVIAVRAVESVDAMTADFAEAALGTAGPHQHPHHQRSTRRKPRNLRHQQQTSSHHRVGISRRAIP